MSKEPLEIRKSTEIGKVGEDLAANYLICLGHQIVCRNYRYKRSEIDLISECDNLLIFTEVKYRSNINFGQPESFVSNLKMKRIKEAAGYYLYEKNWSFDIRFDIISIVSNKNTDLIEHFTDCF